MFLTGLLDIHANIVFHYNYLNRFFLHKTLSCLSSENITLYENVVIPVGLKMWCTPNQNTQFVGKQLNTDYVLNVCIYATAIWQITSPLQVLRKHTLSYIVI